MYRAYFSRYLNQHVVLDPSGILHTAWTTYQEAKTVAKDLNRYAYRLSR